MVRSIGEILRKAREKKHLTVDDVYKDIKVHPSYIKALENDDYSVFSGKVHSKGFLKLYADFLNLNVEEILALWRREYELEFDNKKEEKFFQRRALEAPKFIVTPYILGITFLITATLVFFGYLYYQYKNFTGAPKLTVYYPPDNLVTQGDILDITGKTDLDSEVSVNNQKIILSPDGSFVESVHLKEGLNTISIKAQNKFDKQTTFVKTIIYRPEKKEEVIQSSESTSSLSPPPSITQ